NTTTTPALRRRSGVLPSEVVFEEVFLIVPVVGGNQPFHVQAKRVPQAEHDGCLFAVQDGSDAAPEPWQMAHLASLRKQVQEGTRPVSDGAHFLLVSFRHIFGLLDMP